MAISVEGAQKAPQATKSLGVRNTAVVAGFAGAGMGLGLTKAVAAGRIPARALVMSGALGAIGGAAAGMWSGALSESGDSGQRIALLTGMVGAGLLFGFGRHQEWVSPMLLAAGVATGTAVSAAAAMFAQGTADSH